MCFANFCTLPGAINRLQIQQDRWVRGLLQAGEWHPTGQLHEALGIGFTGAAYAVKDLALKRAKIWLLPYTDFHRELTCPAGVDVEGTWAHNGCLIMRQWLLRDMWELCLHDPGEYQRYKAYVVETVKVCCDAYFDGQASSRIGIVRPRGVCNFLEELRRQDVPLDVCRASRSLCRLRCGLLHLTHLHQQRSKARAQLCIFCDAVVLEALPHIFLSCSMWSERGRQILGTCCSTGDEVMEELRNVIFCSASSRKLREICAFSRDLDRAATSFWRS